MTTHDNRSAPKYGASRRVAGWDEAVRFGVCDRDRMGGAGLLILGGLDVRSRRCGVGGSAGQRGGDRFWRGTSNAEQGNGEAWMANGEMKLWYNALSYDGRVWKDSHAKGHLVMTLESSHT